MQNEIECRIILQTPPAEIDYGLQMGHGSYYEIIQKQRATGEDLSFDFTVSIHSRKDFTLDFSGLFVQKPAEGERFIYINIGVRNIGRLDTSWNHRLQVPLLGITQSMVDQILNLSAVLETTVSVTGKIGELDCIAVKPFAGWLIVKK